MTQNFKLIWTVPNLYDRLINGAFERIRAAFGVKSPLRTTVELDANQAWQTEYSAPVSNNRDLKAALVQAIPILCPIPPEQATVYATKSDADGKLNLLYLRSSQHDKLIAEIGDTNAFTQDGTAFPLEKSLRRTRLLPGTFIAASFAGLLFANIGMSYLANQSGAVNANLRDQEATLRAELKARSDAARQKSTLDVFLATNPAERLPQARLDMLAQYSEATPDGTYWLDVSAEGPETAITGLAQDASKAIADITEALPDKRVSTIGSITADAAGQERFVITISSDTEGPTR